MSLPPNPLIPAKGRDPGKTLLLARESAGMAAPQALSSSSHEEHEGSEEHEGASSEGQPPLVSFACFMFFV